MCSPAVCPHSETVAERRTEKHLEADEIARVMGKGGRKGKQPAAAADDDALLDAAIAENKAQAAAAAEAKAAAEEEAAAIAARQEAAVRVDGLSL